MNLTMSSKLDVLNLAMDGVGLLSLSYAYKDFFSISFSFGDLSRISLLEAERHILIM